MNQDEVVKLMARKDQNTAEEATFKHFMYCPFTGLGLYDGFRGNRWLKNRIEVFKQFVIPSLQAQTNKNFTLWISWRHEEKSNPLVKELVSYLSKQNLNVIHTYTGVCFYDDKYPKEEARHRLLNSLHGAMREELLNATEGEYGYRDVYMTIQPSDDCYSKYTVDAIQRAFAANPNFQAVGFSKGWIMDQKTLEIREWNPKTNPPFYAIRFPRPLFIDPVKHAAYTSLKRDVEGYEAGTPLPSHEWVGAALNYGIFGHIRGFLVGVHGENISTVFDHPYVGALAPDGTLAEFGLERVGPLNLYTGWRRRLFNRLSYGAKRKLRYLAGEKKSVFRPLFNAFYNLLRN